MANEKAVQHLQPAPVKKNSSTARRTKQKPVGRLADSELIGAGQMIIYRRLSRSTIAFTNALTECFYRAKLAALREQGVTVDHA